MKPSFWALICGILFGFGLNLANLLDPHAIQAFLDVGGQWNPAPLVVLGVAVFIYALGFRVLTKKVQPLTKCGFEIPTSKNITKRLVIGSILFGIGWALVGYCPGPAIAALPFGGKKTAVFVFSMLFAGWLAKRLPRETSELV